MASPRPPARSCRKRDGVNPAGKRRETDERTENGPAEEAGAAVEGLSGQAEAQVQPKRLWVWVERSDQARRGGCSLAALRQRLGVMARLGVLQNRVRLPIRHWLPLEESWNVGAAAAERRNPAGHLRGPQTG